MTTIALSATTGKHWCTTEHQKTSEVWRSHEDRWVKIVESKRPSEVSWLFPSLMAFTYTAFKMKTKLAAFKMVSRHHYSWYSSLCVITSLGLWAGLRVWFLSNRTYQTDVTWLLWLGFKRRVAYVSDSCSIICGEARSSVMRYS